MSTLNSPVVRNELLMMREIIKTEELMSWPEKKLLRLLYFKMRFFTTQEIESFKT